MRLRFLCPHHRDWVYFHPQEAHQKLAQSWRYGELLIEQEKWREAVPFLGCAYETTEILLELYSTGGHSLPETLTEQCVSLGHCLLRLNCSEYARLVFKQTLSSLHNVREEGFSELIITRCLAKLETDFGHLFAPKRDVNYVQCLH